MTQWLKCYLIIVLAIAFAGCSSHDMPTAPAPILTNGVYTHPGSKMEFPTSIGAFQRVQITKFSAADVGIGYNLNDPITPIIMTVYVYPAPRVISIGSPSSVAATARKHVFEAHLKSVKGDIVKAHPDAKLISENEYSFSEGGRTHAGQKAVYEFTASFGCWFGGRPQEALSELYLFQDGEWLVKYRITFPKAAAAESKPIVADFLQKLAWPAQPGS